MNMRNMTNAEMLWLTGQIIDADKLRPRFLSAPLLAALLPAIEHVHGQLMGEGDAPAGAAQAELDALSKEGAELDVQQHDRLVRGIYRVTEGNAELAETPEEAEQLRALAARVLPLGLATSQQSWIGEAGSVVRLEAELAKDPALPAALKKVPLAGKRTLLDAVNQLVRAGKRLGEIEGRRVALRGQLAADAEAAAETSPAVSAQAARGEWIATLTTLRSNLNAPKVAVPAALRKEILELVQDAERKADLRERRSSAREAEEKAPPAPTPSQPPTA